MHGSTSHAARVSDETERAAWRFLGFAALFVAIVVGIIVLATLISPGNGWWAGPLGAASVGVLYLLSIKGKRPPDNGRR